VSSSGWPSSWSSLWLGEISTWNHTVAAFVKTAPDLHCDDFGRWFWLEG
jgi:hypothetical protein